MTAEQIREAFLEFTKSKKRVSKGRTIGEELYTITFDGYAFTKIIDDINTFVLENRVIDTDNLVQKQLL